MKKMTMSTKPLEMKKQFVQDSQGAPGRREDCVTGTDTTRTSSRHLMSKSDQKRNEALEELLSEALAAHRRCDYADAIATYTQLISYRPVPGLFSQRGIAYMDLGPRL